MLMANPVGRDVARAKAAQFLSASKTARVKNVQMKEKRLQPVEGGFSHLHIFNIGEDGGFVVVSADDRTDEVLAYSFALIFAVMSRILSMVSLSSLARRASTFCRAERTVVWSRPNSRPMVL